MQKPNENELSPTLCFHLVGQIQTPTQLQIHPKIGGHIEEFCQTQRRAIHVHELNRYTWQDVVLQKWKGGVLFCVKHGKVKRRKKSEISRILVS